jgi:hypothetical protein
MSDDNTEVIEPSETTEGQEGQQSEQQGDDKGADETPEQVKALARTMGWVDGEKFRGDQAKFVGAEDYIRNTHSRNSALNRQLREMNNVVIELKRHHETVRASEIKKLVTEIETLKAQRKVAIADGDVERVEDIERRIDSAVASVPPAPTQTQPQGNPPEFDDWVENNAWYNSDKELREYAIEVGNKNVALPYGELLEFVSYKVKQKFPDKFGRTQDQSSAKQAPRPGASVEGAARKATTQKAFSAKDLTESQKVIMRQFARNNVMTEAEYIADLVKRGDIS